ncbi:MAG: hypothetical protein HFI33_13475 [Lachnospiraceae bacterium]|nr:hypothetical protein [Lachnospiraceae bacterium]
MPDYTQYKKLELPKSPERYSVQVFNKNNTVIDSELHKLDQKNQSQDNLLATKESLNAHINNKNNPHEVDKLQVGLGNVENKSSATIRNELTQDNVTSALGYKPYTPNEVDNKLSLLETKIDWKESVDTYEDIATTYPNPEDGWTVNVKDTDYTYRFNGGSWIAISANAIPKATDDTDGLLSKEDHIKYEDANTQKHVHENKALLDSVTSESIANWSSAYAHSVSEHSPSDAEKNVIIGIQQNGEDIEISEDRKVNITIPTSIDELSGSEKLLSSNYGICSTSATATEKIVDCEDFSLVNGTEITVKFLSSNTVDNITLNVNNTGAKDIYYKDTPIARNYLQKNGTYSFRYNGTYYEFVGDSNTASGIVSTESDGLCPKLEGTGEKYLRDDGTWNTPNGNASLDIPVTLLSSDWIGNSAPYSLTLSLPEIREGMTPLYMLDDSAVSDKIWDYMQYAYSLITGYSTKYAEITFYAADKPDRDVYIILKGVPTQQLEFVDNTVAVVVPIDGFTLNEEYHRYENTIAVEGMVSAAQGSWDIVRSGPVLSSEESKIAANITDVIPLDGAVKIVCLEPPAKQYILKLKGTYTQATEGTTLLAGMQGWFDRVEDVEKILNFNPVSFESENGVSGLSVSNNNFVFTVSSGFTIDNPPQLPIINASGNQYSVIAKAKNTNLFNQSPDEFKLLGRMMTIIDNNIAHVDLAMYNYYDGVNSYFVTGNLINQPKITFCGALIALK